MRLAVRKSGGTALAPFITGMMTRLQLTISSVIVGAFLGLTPVSAFGQQESSRPLVWDITRSVLIDPTTYVPAAVSYEAKRQDWKTGQVLFEHGWVEENPRFTVSGLPNDVPLSYAAGKRVILKQTLGTLQLSIVNNISAVAIERVLSRYPNRRKLIRTVSWIERISFATWISYLHSIEHFRQTGRNRRLAREQGFN